MSLQANRSGRSLGYLSLFLACVAVGAVCVALTGCAFFDALSQAASATNPSTGHTVGDDIGSGALGVLLNPASWPAWGQLGSGLALLGAGTAGYLKFKKKI